jgi:hypothetical protein
MKQKFTCILARIKSKGLVMILAEQLLNGPHKLCTTIVGTSSGITGLNLPK